MDADSNRARLGGDLTPGERLAGRLPASGRPHDSISLERNQDYGSDSDLCFGIGNSEVRVRVTGFDLHRLRSLLLDQGYDLGELKDRAAGYRLATEDQRATAQDREYVREFLDGLLTRARAVTQTADDDLFPVDPAGEDAVALERVIALLESM